MCSIVVHKVQATGAARTWQLLHWPSALHNLPPAKLLLLCTTIARVERNQ